MIRLSRLYDLSNHKHISVKSFLDMAKPNLRDGSLWRRPLIDRNEMQQKILQSSFNMVVLTVGEDILVWFPGKGNFSSKHFIQLCDSSSTNVSAQSTDWNTTWLTKFPPKLKIFL